MISIGVVDQHSFTRDCLTRSLKAFDDDLVVIPFESSEDCSRSAAALDVVLYHEHEDDGDNIDTRLSRLGKLLEICPVIILSPVDNPRSVTDAFERGVRGYIPTANTPAELIIEIIRLVKAGGSFVPLSGLQLQTNAGSPRSPGRQTNQLFTPRQIAVLNQLRQGKANKIIAYELAMSESTVKVHVRNIMKKMSASNRTEAAYRAQMFQDGVSIDVIHSGD